LHKLQLDGEAMMAEVRRPLAAFFTGAKKHFFDFDPKSPGSSWAAILFFCFAWPYVALEIFRRYAITHDPLVLCGGMALVVGALYSFGQLVQKVRHVTRRLADRSRS
jgi:hypothetical protein